MEREACVCDHGLERSDLCAEIIIIIIIIQSFTSDDKNVHPDRTVWLKRRKNKVDRGRKPHLQVYLSSGGNS